jgi:hypothetical protein
MTPSPCRRADRGAATGESPQEGRRSFLAKVGVLPVAWAAGQGSEKAEAAPTEEPKLPQIQLGPYSVSRLICGANPFHGGSHLSVFVNREMRRYYTQEQILKTLRRCEAVGINCWQTGVGDIELYRQFVDQGLNVHYLAIAAGDPSTIDRLSRGGCIGIAHHGEHTDRLFKTGRIDPMQDYLKRIRDAGLLVGVSTHMPDVVDAVESKGWDVDYYMACVYERHRSREQLEQLLGQAPIPVGEVYLPNDPPRMFKVMRQTKKPCLAFKILAAGRLSERREWVERAFRETFESIKPQDAVIVGIYDRYSDQASENAALVRRFSAGSTPA